MLIHIDREEPRKLDGAAHILITLDAKGCARLRSFFQGRQDASYAQLTDSQLLSKEIPKLLAELRGQIQSDVGSATTE